ncbi:uncharacterized protein LOC142321707 [Lycorma delicatula]|uniref:uncharacterized protein LOC142321707 n=1 Tax=Lycorma delicatula TaxID=130591 RepID=UPI003F50F7AD
MEPFDTDRFILEIQEQPIIWDYRNDAYSNKIEKVRAWDKVCAAFHSCYNELSNLERNEIASQLQRRWKSLRDSFNRELKKRKSTKSGDDVSLRKQYLYFNQLSFLLPLAEQRASSSAMEDIAEDSFEPKEVTPPSTPPKRSKLPDDSSEPKEVSLPQPPPKIIKPINEEKLTYNSEKSVSINQELLRTDKPTMPMYYDESHDYDRLFMLSVVGDLKKVSEELKSDAKIEIIQILEKYKRQSSNIFDNHFQNDGPSGVTPTIKIEESSTRMQSSPSSDSCLEDA